MNTQSNFEITAKKHWATFIIPGVLVLIGLLFLTSSTIWKVLGLLLIVFNIIKLISLNSVKWTLTSSDLYITKGFLPWAKTQIQVPIFDIYDSSCSSGMFGHFFGFGHVFIRRTEGNTTQVSETSLVGAKDFSGHINQFVQDYKKSKNNIIINQAPINQSIVEELKHLADLKKNGELTQVEYDTMKSRLIKGS
jgi:hypothetical protein